MSRSKRSKRDAEPEDDEEDEERMPYFVPEEGIDIEPLALYTRSILDDGAKVKLGNHPQRPSEKGFWIISSVAVSREDIAAMIEDTRLWNRENKRGHYVNSETANRRLKIGRAQQGRERALKAQTKAQRDVEDPRYAQQNASRASGELDQRYIPPPSLGRSSADVLASSDRERQLVSTSPGQRPASIQPVQLEPRRSSATPQYTSSASPGYVQASAQYTIQTNLPQAQYASYGTNTSVYESAPAPYADNKRSTATTQPSTTGTQGFQSLYATSGGPPAPRAPNQGQRRHGTG